MQLRPRGLNGNALREHTEPRVEESRALQEAAPLPPIEVPGPPVQLSKQAGGTVTEDQPSPPHEQGELPDCIAHKEDMAWSTGSPQTPLKVHLEGEDFLAVVTLLCRTGPQTNSGHFGQSSDSLRPSDSLAQGLPALGIVPFSCLSYIPLNYVHSYLYTHLYDVARFPSLYIDLAPSPYFTPFNIICHSSSSGDTLSSPMDHTPTGSLPLLAPLSGARDDA